MMERSMGRILRIRVRGSTGESGDWDRAGAPGYRPEHVSGPAISRLPARSQNLLADEERGHNEGDGGQQLHENVERRTGGVLEGIADGVADDGGCVRERLLADHVAIFIEQVTRLDVLLGVVPGAAAVVEDGGEQDAGDGADHQHARNGLVAEQET